MCWSRICGSFLTLEQESKDFRKLYLPHLKDYRQVFIMATQKAVALIEAGKPLILTDVPIPKPKENEILIKLTALGRKYHSAPLDKRNTDTH